MRLIAKALERLLGWGSRETGIIPEYIPNAGLTLDMIPPRTAPLREIVRFSLTFDGYWRRGSFNRCAEVPWTREGGTLSEMRACLYHELKHMSFPGRGCGSGDEAFIRGLLDRLRDKVARDERD
jgi:hypothetical protein